MTQEFYISVTPVRDGEYLVRTERVAMGVPLAEELVSWDVDRWLSQAAQVMHDPLVGILRGSRSGSATTTSDTESYDLVSLGQTLYNAIFQGTIRDSWMIAQGVAQNQKEILRLRLGLKDELLPLLPWEVIHDGARPLATNTDIIFSRYKSNNTHTSSAGEWLQAADTEHPLRILMILAAPTDQEILQLQQEAQHLQQELQREVPGTEGPNLELTILDQPGRERLTQALEQGHYDILHYAGHSDLSASGGDLYLVSDKTGLTEVLSGDDLAGLLVNNGVRMAVFNSCQGVYSANASESGSSSGSLADALLKRNVPAVLAMAEQIPDEVALNLSRLFYRNLKQRCPIDLSLARARQGLLSSYGSDQLYWALPILYMHSEFEGYLQHNPQKLQPGKEDWEIPLGEEDMINGFAPLTAGDVDWPSGSISSDQQEVDRLLHELDTGYSDGEQPGIAANTASPHDERAEALEYHRLGQQMMADGKTVEAMEAYGAAIRLDPEFAEAYYDLGQTFEQTDSANEAITSYKMALRYKPGWADAENSIKRLANLYLNPPQEEQPTETALAPVGTQAHTTTETQPPERDRVFSEDLTAKPKPKTQSGGLTNGKTLAMAAATVAVLGSVWFLAGRPQNSDTPQTPLSDAPITTDAKSKELTAIASQSFSQGNLKRGSESIEQLLDRGALVQAESSLSAVSPKQIDTPIISFLRGRLGWEKIKRQEPTAFSLNDIQRYWRKAVQEQPNDHFYRNSYGFSLFADRGLDEARKEWKRVSNELENSDRNAKQTQELLTAYAGQAIVLLKQYEKSNEEDNDKLKAALALRDQVLREDSMQFQVDNLVQDWRWDGNSIAAWKQLLSIKSSEG